MKFHNAGKFNGDLESLPKREHEEGAVMFKEPTDMTKFSIYMNLLAFVLMFALIFLTSFIVGEFTFDTWGCLLALVCMVPHEFLHAVCFKEDVYMYNNLKHIHKTDKWLLKEMTINTKTPPKINLQSFNKSILYRPPTLYVPKSGGNFPHH